MSFLHKMILRLVLFSLSLSVASVFLLPTQTAWAIPAFARKYNVPCTLCHVAFPKLNDFGATFRDNGYQMMSDQDLPEKHPEGFWPIAMRTTVGYQSADITNQPTLDGTRLTRATTRSAGFTGLDILSFGTLGRNISYGIVYTPGLKDAGISIGDSRSESDLESAFVRLDNLAGSSLLNFKAGKFELDLPFSEKRSLTLNTPYVVYHYLSGVPYGTVLGNKSVLPLFAADPNLTNQSGFGLGDNQVGAELMGHLQDGVGVFRYSASVISNSRSDAFGGGKQAEFYGHLTQSLGGWGATEGQRIGIFGFAGRTPTVNESGIAGAGHEDRSFYRSGVDLNFNYTPMKINFIVAYIRGQEAGGLFCSPNAAGKCVPSPTAQSAVWNGEFAELNYLATPNAVIVYRYDIVRNSRQIDQTLTKKFNDIDSHTVAFRYALLVTTRDELWVHTEFNQTKSHAVTQDPASLETRNVIANTLLVGLDFAF